MGMDEQLLDRARARVGTQLNEKWRLDRLIGCGGMSVVYEATHRNRKRAAIKLLNPELSADPSIRERFLREGYVANTVGHRGTVRIDDDDVAEDGAAYLVMELLDGETVQARWERKGRRLRPGESLSLADQLLDVLIAAHAAGIVHRDLKPENLYLTRDGVLKVLDFGIARVQGAEQGHRVTRTGSVMGTPAFMPPEQARGRWENVDARSDLWAVGAILFTLMTGRFVHAAETANEVLALACVERAQPLRSLDPTIPEPVAQLVDKALAYDSCDRFPDAASMQTALRAAYHGLFGETSARAPSYSFSELTETADGPRSASRSGSRDAGSSRRSPGTSRGGDAVPETEINVTRSAGMTGTRRGIGLLQAIALVGALLSVALVGARIVTGRWPHRPKEVESRPWVPAHDAPRRIDAPMERPAERAEGVTDPTAPSRDTADHRDDPSPSASAGQDPTLAEPPDGKRLDRNGLRGRVAPGSTRSLLGAGSNGTSQKPKSPTHP